jgi:hypothetical protein
MQAALVDKATPGLKKIQAALQGIKAPASLANIQR